jgi:hypothetical protein
MNAREAIRQFRQLHADREELEESNRLRAGKRKTRVVIQPKRAGEDQAKANPCTSAPGGVER